MTLSLIEFIARTRIDQRTLELWIEEEWVIPQGAADMLEFTEADVARAQLIRDLALDLGVNAEGIGVALHLIDQIHDLRGALADLGERVRRAGR